MDQICLVVPILPGRTARQCALLLDQFIPQHDHAIVYSQVFQSAAKSTGSTAEMPRHPAVRRHWDAVKMLHRHVLQQRVGQ